MKVDIKKLEQVYTQKYAQVLELNLRGIDEHSIIHKSSVVARAISGFSKEDALAVLAVMQITMLKPDLVQSMIIKD